MKMNKAAVKRMIARIERVPEAYDQSAWYVETDRSTPCGTVACLAGEAVICATPNEPAGIRRAIRLLRDGGIVDAANKVLGLSGRESPNVYTSNAGSWPMPHGKWYAKAKTHKARARVAVAYLREALERGTMLW